MSDAHEPRPENDDTASDQTPAHIAQALNITASLQPALEISRFAANLQRQLNSILDTSSVRSTLEAVSRAAESARAVQSAAASIQSMQNAVTSQLSGFFAAMEQVQKAVWPENWAGVDNLDFDLVETVCVDEGIPLMWVPRSTTVQALLAAPDVSARRRLLDQRRRGILTDCRSLLGTVAQPDLQHIRGYAREAIDVLASGHAAAAQSLAANLLETLITAHIDEDVHDLLKRRKAHRDTRLDLDEFHFRAGFTLAPVWSAYMHYYANRGDAVPRQFARNATAHSVTRQQFSRVNAVVAVMVVCSLLRLIDGPDR
jgi:hypothetical protein